MKSWSERAWLLFGATSALHFLSSNEADNDLWVHLLLGKRILASGEIPRTDDLSFTAAGANWVDHEWLAQVVMGFLYQWLGPTGLWLTKLALGATTAALLWRSIRRRGGAVQLQVFALVLTLATLSRGFATRPQIFTYTFVAALLLWLDSRNDRPRSALFSAAVAAVWLCVWANLHGAFIVGLGILGLWAASPPWQRLPARMVLPVVGLLGACLNPYGPSLFTYIWGELSVPHPLTEWQPVRFGDPTQWPFWIILIGVAATVPFARLLRESPWRGVLLAGTAFLALRHQRHVPLFAICAAAPLADQLARIAERARGFRLSRAASAIITAAALVMACLQVGLFFQRAVGERASIVFQAEEYPVNAVHFAKMNRLSGKLALPLDWGGYALWHLSPRMKVSMDGRFATVYSPAVVQQNFDFFNGENIDLLERHQPEYILVTSNVVLPKSAGHDYTPIFRDQVAALYARNPGPEPSTRKAITGRIPFP